MIAITLDIDWAPDWIIDCVAERLIKHKVKVTWFVTHDSDAIKRLKKHPELFELGIHPNFHPKNTQGGAPEQVLKNLLEIVPEAKSMRTHGLYQSTNLLEMASQKGISYDVSLFLPQSEPINPHRLFFESGSSLIRLPYVWEDDLEMAKPQPCLCLDQFAHFQKEAILDFHPIHIVLNSCDMETYTQYKNNGWKGFCQEQMPFQTHARGIGDLFDACLSSMREGGQTVSELAQDCEELS